MVRPVVIRLPNSQAVAEQVASDLFTFVSDALSSQTRVDIALTGGTVGIASLSAASSQPFNELDLSRLHIWWGDERFVPSQSLDRNSRQAENAWLRKLNIPPENVHEFPSSDFELSLKVAESSFNEYFQSTGIHFDLMLMGVGPDGHIASLFPGKDNLTSDASIISEDASPKAPSQRLTFSYEEINRSAQIWFTVAGQDKAEAVASAFGDNPESLPVGRVRGREKTVWYVDQTAGTLVWGC